MQRGVWPRVPNPPTRGQTPTEERKTVVIKNQLAKIGIKLVPKPLARKTYYDQISKVDNGFDMYWGGWGAGLAVGLDRLPGDLRSGA